MHFKYSAYPNKLNLGCGFDIRKGYLNVDLNDFHNPDLVADVTDLRELPESYYKEIIALDILEHIERSKTLHVLINWNRLLIGGGKLTLQVPSLIGLLELLKCNQNNISKSMELIQCCFGSQQYDGDYHYTSFTEQIIKFYLSEAGFRINNISVKDNWLFIISANKVIETPKTKNAEDKREIYNAQVTALYKSLLNREPDIEGLQYFVNKLLNHEIDINGVKKEFINSQEYINKKLVGSY